MINFLYAEYVHHCALQKKCTYFSNDYFHDIFHHGIILGDMSNHSYHGDISSFMVNSSQFHSKKSARRSPPDLRKDAFCGRVTIFTTGTIKMQRMPITKTTLLFRLATSAQDFGGVGCGRMSTPDEPKPWLINCVPPNSEMVPPQINSRLGLLIRA